MSSQVGISEVVLRTDVVSVDDLLKAHQLARPCVHKILRGHGYADSVDDVLQEVFVKAYFHRSQFRGESKLSTWYFSIAVNTALMFLRSQKISAVDVDMIDIPSQRCFDNPETTAYHNEMKNLVIEKLLRLSPPRREAFLRCLLGETASTTCQKSRLHGARQALKKQLRGLSGVRGERRADPFVSKVIAKNR